MELAVILRAAGQQVVEVDGWRDAGGRGDQNVGVMLHHTASPEGSAPAASLYVVTHGRPDLSPPLCNLLLARDGVWYCVAAGTAHDSGPGSSVVLAQARRGEAPRGDAGVLGLVDDVDMNPFWIDIEIENNGRGEEYPDIQREAALTGVRALLHALGKGPANCIGHKESTRRKIDPSFDMVAFRHLLTYVPPPTEDDMPLTPADAALVADAVHARFIRFDAAGKPDGIGAQEFHAIQQIREGDWANLDWLDERLKQTAAAIVHEIAAAVPGGAIDADAVGKAVVDRLAALFELAAASKP